MGIKGLWKLLKERGFDPIKKTSSRFAGPGSSRSTPNFDALEWLAAMCSHIPDRGESRRWREYYGYYSPAFRGISRGKRKETKEDGVPCILEADKSSKEYRKNWARLIQKIGACPRLDRGRSIP